MNEKKIYNKPLTFKEKSKMCLYERMLHYQDQEKDIAFNPINSVLLVKVSFKNIKRFYKVLDQPFDNQLFDLLQQTAIHLLNTFKSKYAHVGNSDITLVLHGTEKSPIEYAGRKQKLISLITGTASSFFSLKLASLKDIDSLYDGDVYPVLDVNIFKVPNKTETGNALLWSERESCKKSINNINYYLGIKGDGDIKPLKDRIHTLKEKYNYDWYRVDPKFRTGIYIKRKKVISENDKISKYVTEFHLESFSNTSIEDRNKRIFN